MKVGAPVNSVASRYILDAFLLAKQNNHRNNFLQTLLLSSQSNS